MIYKIFHIREKGIFYICFFKLIFEIHCVFYACITFPGFSSPHAAQTSSKNESRYQRSESGHRVDPERPGRGRLQHTESEVQGQGYKQVIGVWASARADSDSGKYLGGREKFWYKSLFRTFWSMHHRKYFMFILSFNHKDSTVRLSLTLMLGMRLRGGK